MTDHTIDSSMATADLDQNGVDDSYVADLDGDGLIDMVESDTDGDTYTDTAVLDTDGDTVADTVIADTDGDLVADTAAVLTADTTSTGDLYPVDAAPDSGEQSVQAVSGTSGTADLYDVPSEIESTMTMVNQATSDANTLAQDAVNPGSESAGDVAAASQRADNMAQNSQMVEGYVHQQEVSNDIAERDLRMSTVEEASRVQTDAEIALQESESVLAEGY